MPIDHYQSASFIKSQIKQYARILSSCENNIEPVTNEAQTHLHPLISLQNKTIVKGSSSTVLARIEAQKAKLAFLLEKRSTDYLDTTYYYSFSTI